MIMIIVIIMMMMMMTMMMISRTFHNQVSGRVKEDASLPCCLDTDFLREV